MELILIRGLPGSGKTTMAKTQYPDHIHFEADQYFEKDGEYLFRPHLIKDAHEQCQNNTRRALGRGRDVVVANTFTQKWEMEPYHRMAVANGATVKVIEATGKFKNIHGVPDEVIEKMRNRWETL